MQKELRVELPPYGQGNTQDPGHIQIRYPKNGAQENHSIEFNLKNRTKTEMRGTYLSVDEALKIVQALLTMINYVRTIEGRQGETDELV